MKGEAQLHAWKKGSSGTSAGCNLAHTCMFLQISATFGIHMHSILFMKVIRPLVDKASHTRHNSHTSCPLMAIKTIKKTRIHNTEKLRCPACSVEVHESPPMTMQHCCQLLLKGGSKLDAVKLNRVPVSDGECNSQTFFHEVCLDVEVVQLGARIQPFRYLG